MAYRINWNGGIIPIRTNPNKPGSSFKDRNFVQFLLKTRNIRFIRLRNRGRMVVREESLMTDTVEPYNRKATKLLHEQSNQLTAIVHGPVIVIHSEDWNT